jgi:pimeloyl-ACP methyl ester carboxylesterase
MTPRKAYADGPFGQVHYAVLGDGKPLVLLHQSPTDMVQFARVMPLLAAAGIRAIAVDLPGFGTSDVPDHPPTIAEYAAIVPAVLDALGIARASLLGHHTGALIATEAALRYPERADKVILHGPLPMTDEERAMWRQLLSREKEWNLRWDGSHLLEQWNYRYQAQAAWTDIEAFHANFVHGLAAGRTLWYAHDAVMSYRHEEAMDRLQHPCLILANTGDAIYGFSQRAKERYPRFAYAELPGGTIDAIDELPQAWTDAVAEFLL